MRGRGSSNICKTERSRHKANNIDRMDAREALHHRWTRATRCIADDRLDALSTAVAHALLDRWTRATRCIADGPVLRAAWHMDP